MAATFMGLKYHEGQYGTAKDDGNPLRADWARQRLASRCFVTVKPAATLMIGLG